MSGPQRYVLDTESGHDDIVGRHLFTCEDSVVYARPDGSWGMAPYDCVRIVTVSKEPRRLYGMRARVRR